MEHISTLIASFIGAAAGGAITALGFLFKRSEESRQKYRNLLFELFGLYRVFHATRELTPTKYVEALGEAFAKLGHPELQSDPKLRTFLEPLVAPQIEAMLDQLSCWDEKNYLSAVRIIAPINPVLAHTFRANTLLINCLDMAHEYWQKYLETLKEHGVDPAAIEPALPVIEEELLDKILAELKSDIKHISNLAGVRDSYRTRRWFRRHGEPLERLLAPIAEQLLSKMSSMQQD